MADSGAGAGMTPDGPGAARGPRSEASAQKAKGAGHVQGTQESLKGLPGPRQGRAEKQDDEVAGYNPACKMYPDQINSKERQHSHK